MKKTTFLLLFFTFSMFFIVFLVLKVKKSAPEQQKSAEMAPTPEFSENLTSPDSVTKNQENPEKTAKIDEKSSKIAQKVKKSAKKSSGESFSANPAEFLSISGGPEGLEPVSRGRNSFENAEKIASREGLPDTDGVFQRDVLLRTDFKYPFVKISTKIRRSAQGRDEVIQDRAMVADHVVIRLHDHLSEKDLMAELAGTVWKIRRKMSAPGHYLLEGYPVDLDLVDRGLAWCGAHSNVIAQADSDDLVYALETIPNDPLFDDLWALKNTGQNGGVAGADMEAALAWDYLTSAANVLVAVIDTGIDYSHPDLSSNMWVNANEIPENGLDDDGNGFIDDIYGWDFCNDDYNPRDDHFHGTHVAGTIGAVGNNNYGVVGVCWKVRIMALKFLSATGSGAISDAIDAVYYATDNGARVLNNSWGGGGYSDLLHAAIEYAASSNVLFVAAAGNSGENADVYPHYPSSYGNENVLSVAATDSSDELAGFSNYGALTVDVAAPGVSILSTYPVSHASGPFHAISGTSMATPQVVGLAALLLSWNDMSATNLKQAVMDCVEPLPSLEGKVLTEGRINVLKAVTSNISLALDRARYFYNDWCEIVVNDATEGAVVVRVQSASGDEEYISLAADSANQGRYTNRVWLTPSPTPVLGNGQLEVIEGDTISATYSNVALGLVLQREASVSVQLEIDVPVTYVILPSTSTHYVVEGLNNGNVHVDMVISNEYSGEAYTFSATNEWQAPSMLLSGYAARLWISGTNVYGTYDEVRVDVLKKGPAGTNYLALGGSDEWPYLSWATAGSNAALVGMSATDGNTILASNGVYEISESVSLPKNVTMRSLAGPTSCVIQQTAQDHCVQLTNSGAALAGFTLRGGHAQYGGGIFATRDGVVSNCVIRDNWGMYGGAVAATGSLLIVDCLLQSNTAYLAAGVYLKNSAGIKDSELLDNCASRSGGGGFLYDTSVMEDCLLRGNRADDFGGAGVICYATTRVTSCVIEFNVAGGVAGGVYMSDDCIVSNCIIRGNRVTEPLNGGGYAGAAMMYSGLLTHSQIESNSAVYFAGAICTAGNPDWMHTALDGGEVSHCVIRDNQAEQGGGLFLYQRGFFQDCLIEGNQATAQGLGYSCYGGGVWCKGGILRNCTVANNRADEYAGGVYAGTLWSSSGTIENSIIFENTALFSPDYRVVDESGQLVLDMRYSCAMPLIPGLHNIAADPGFLHSGDYPYALMPGSPCISAGENFIEQANATDLAGAPRIQWVKVEMGAYEFSASNLVCGLSLTNREGVLPLEVVIRGYADGDATEQLYYSWDLDGDGVTDIAGYNVDMVTGLYAQVGSYNIKLTVSNELGEVATMIYSNAVHVGPGDLYVTPNGQHVFPFTNWVDAATNIQSALDIGVAGTTVWVSNGTYYLTSQLSLSNGIHVCGVSAPEAVVLDGQHTTRCVRISHPDAQLSYLTIQHGLKTNGAGAGVLLLEGGTLDHCVLQQNETREDGEGGAAYMYYGGLLDHCVIRDNLADGPGGGVAIMYGGEQSGCIRNSLITDNETATGNGGYGGGGVYTRSGGILQNCTVVDNISRRHGGGVFLGQNGRIENSICYYNTYPNGQINGWYTYYPSSVTVDHSCMSTTFVSMLPGSIITNAPEFIDRADGQYHLMPSSPCIDQGTNQFWMGAALDFDDNPRIAFGTVDMGAYEIPESLSCFIWVSPVEGVVPMTGTLMAVVGGVAQDSLFYRWDVGYDGSVEYAGSAYAEVKHTFTNTGVFSIHLLVSNSVGESAECVVSNRLQTEIFSYMHFDGVGGTIWTAGIPYEVTITARGTNDEAISCFDACCSLTVEGYPERVVSPDYVTFVDGVWSGQVAVLGIVDDGALRVDDGVGHAGTSMLFDVISGALDHLQFETIAPLQQAGVSIGVALSATDAEGYRRPGYSNAVQLSAWSFGHNDEFITLGHEEEWSSLPFDRDKPRTQSIYLKEEIGQAMQIQSIALNVASVGYVYLGQHILQGWTIRVKHTTNVSFDVATDWDTNGWTVVFTNNYYMHTIGWDTHQLQTPFEYNGVDNLMVEFSLDGGPMWKSSSLGTDYSARRSLLATSSDDSTPPQSDFWAPNIRFQDTPFTLPCTPTVTPAFVEGAWTGSIQVLESGTNVYIVAEDAEGLTGRSNPFHLDTVALTIHSLHGYALPASGTHYYTPGAAVTCRLTNAVFEVGSTQWVCLGWAGTGSLSNQPTGGTEVEIPALNENSTLTWSWTKNYWLEIIPGAGTISVTNGWYADGAVVLAEMTPAAGYDFWYWTGDTNGCAVSGNQISIPISYSRNISARYKRTFYVNDHSTNLDYWCSAPGDDALSGLFPNLPKASVQSVLEDYDLEPGDTVRIDTGTYTMTNDIYVTDTDEGSALAPLLFEASPYGVVFDRDDTNSSGYSAAWYLYKADYVELRTAIPSNTPAAPVRWAKCVNARRGIRAEFSDYTQLEYLNLTSNREYGVYLVCSYYVTNKNLLVHHNNLYGLGTSIQCVQLKIENCTFAQNALQQVVFQGDESLNMVNSILYSDIENSELIHFHSDNIAFEMDYNCYFTSNGARMGYFGDVFEHFADWRAISGVDEHSLGMDPQFVDLVAGDYHLASRVGCYVADQWTNDTRQSPCIDAGDPAVSFGREPLPNGERCNIGAYGDSPWASLSDSTRKLILLQPRGHEFIRNIREPYAIKWQCAGSEWQAGDTLTMEYSLDEGSNWVVCATSVAFDQDSFSWYVGALPSLPFYRMRIICEQQPAIQDISDANFRIGSNIVYYVNDDSLNHDLWSQAVGDDGYTGLSPAQPKATVQSVLDTYNLEAGDMIRIDTGDYALSLPIELGLIDSGDIWEKVYIEFSPYGVVIDRGDLSSSGWYLNNCEYVYMRTVSDTNHPAWAQSLARMTGGKNGVQLSGTTHCLLDRMETSGNQNGIYTYSANDTFLQHVLSVQNTSCGLYMDQNSHSTLLNYCSLADNANMQIIASTFCSALTLSNCIVSTSQDNQTLISLFVHYSPFGGSWTAMTASDYNLFYTGANSVLIYRSGAHSNLAAWQVYSGKDTHSMCGDPLFVDPAAGDYHLQSQAGRYELGSWVSDTTNSPALDAAAPEPLCEHELMPHGYRANIGAYGNTEWASHSSSNRVFHMYVASLVDDCQPSVGKCMVEDGSNLAAWLNVQTQYVGTLATQYIFSGWSLSGGRDSQGDYTGLMTNLFFAVTNDITLTWHWDINYWLDLSADNHGTVDQVSSWQPKDSLATLEALPETYYHFTTWTGDLFTNDSSIEVLMNRPLSLHAAFAANLTTNTLTPEWWLAAHTIPTNFAEHVLYDPDADGFCTWEEYIADTDPTNALSHLSPARVQRDGTDIQIMVDSVSSSRVYSLYWKTNLQESAAWQLQASQQQDSPIQFTLTNTVQGFYRTGVHLPE